MTKPIRPEEIVGKKTELIPDYVFEAFNELIAQNWNGHSSVIKLRDASNHIMTKAPSGVTKDELFEKKYLDVEDSYREVGWKVEFDNPGYNETYDAVFKFYKSKR